MKHFTLAALLAAASLSAYADAVPEVLYDVEGDTKVYTCRTTGFSAFYGIFYEVKESRGEIVYAADGKTVYLRDITASGIYPSYVKGTLKDDVVEVTLPQAVAVEDETPLYLTLCEYAEVTDPDTGQSGRTYLPVAGTHTLTYSVAADGTLTLTQPDNGGSPEDVTAQPQRIAGIVNSLEAGDIYAWSGFGVAYQTWREYVDLSLTIPADVETEQWAWLSGEGTAGFVEVGVRDNDLWIAGLYPELPQAALHGTISGNSVHLDVPQMMGTDPVTDQFIWMVGIEFDGRDLETTEMLNDGMTLTWDAAAKRLAMDNPGLALIVTTGSDGLYERFYDYLNMTFFYQDPAAMNANPKNPTFVELLEMDVDWGFGSIAWNIPPVNVNGAVLDTSRMYYNIYFDGELYTFTPDLYWDLAEDMTDVPYNYYDSMDFWVMGSIYDISFYEEYTSFGVQSFYRGTDGVLYSSDLVTYGDWNAITAPAAEATPLETRYYNLQGQRVDADARGLVLEAVRYTDGTLRTRKTVR